MSEEILRLCPECALKAVERSTKAIEANPDKDADWWAEWWGRDIERNIKRMREHCRGKL